MHTRIAPKNVDLAYEHGHIFPAWRSCWGCHTERCLTQIRPHKASERMQERRDLPSGAVVLSRTYGSRSRRGEQETAFVPSRRVARSHRDAARQVLRSARRRWTSLLARFRHYVMRVLQPLVLMLASAPLVRDTCPRIVQSAMLWVNTAGAPSTVASPDTASALGTLYQNGIGDRSVNGCDDDEKESGAAAKRENGVTNRSYRLERTAFFAHARESLQRRRRRKDGSGDDRFLPMLMFDVHGKHARVHALLFVALALVALAIGGFFGALVVSSHTRRQATVYWRTVAQPNADDDLRDRAARVALQADEGLPRAWSHIVPRPHGLLTALQSGRDKAASARGGSEHGAELADDTALYPRKLMFLHTVGESTKGRIAAIATALSYTRHTHRALVVLWDVSLGGIVPQAPRIHVDSPRNDVWIVKVNGLRLDPDDSDWADLNVVRLDATSPGTLDNLSLGARYIPFSDEAKRIRPVLDDVIALKDKHVYVRAGAPLLSVYASSASSAGDFGECFTIYNDDALRDESGRLAPGFAPNHVRWMPPASPNRASEREEPGALAQTAEEKRITRELMYADPSLLAKVRSAIQYGDFPFTHNSGTRLRTAYKIALKNRLKPAESSRSILATLNGEYRVPLVFLQAMSDRKRRQLLYSLEQSRSKRTLIVHTQYGLGNRLRALGSAMAVARETGRVLVLVWVPDVHLNCTFSDLFANEAFVTIDRVDVPWPPTEIRPFDAALASVDFWNMMRLDSGPVHDPLKVNVDPRDGRHLYVKTAYVVRSSHTPNIIKTTSKYWNIMRSSLVPRVEVLDLVRDPGLRNLPQMVGVHIRARTLENDIKGVAKESYGSGSATTDHWRNLTGTATFVNRIRKMPTSTRLFVAADTPAAVQVLSDEFGSDRIFSLRRTDECASRTPQCVRLALADILCLAQVPTLLGSHWSSFTEAAVRLNDRLKKVSLAGVHFGRAPAS